MKAITFAIAAYALTGVTALQASPIEVQEARYLENGQVALDVKYQGDCGERKNRTSNQRYLYKKYPTTMPGSSC